MLEKTWKHYSGITDVHCSTNCPFKEVIRDEYFNATVTRKCLLLRRNLELFRDFQTVTRAIC